MSPDGTVHEPVAVFVVGVPLGGSVWRWRMRDLGVSADRPHANPFPFPSVAERVSWHLQEGTHTLYVCPHPWAIRHHFTNTQTGETIRVRCNLWTCEYCGPR